MPKKGDPFSLKAWTIDNKVPCPYCIEWISKPNIARHCKNMYNRTKDSETPHNETPADLLNKNYEMAVKMFNAEIEPD